MMKHWPVLLAFAVTTFLGIGFSLGIETTQNYLFSRVPSNLDWACNSLGVLLGASAGAHWGRDILDGGRLYAWRERRFLRGASGDFGLLLVALWFLSQLNAEIILFGSGNLRGLLGLPAALPFAAGHLVALETALIAGQTLAIALIGARLAANRPRLLPVALIAGRAGVEDQRPVNSHGRSARWTGMGNAGFANRLGARHHFLDRSRANITPSAADHRSHVAHARHGARQSDAGQPLLQGHIKRLAAGAFCQFQRPDTADGCIMAVSGLAMADAFTEPPE